MTFLHSSKKTWMIDCWLLGVHWVISSYLSKVKKYCFLFCLCLWTCCCGFLSRFNNGINLLFYPLNNTDIVEAMFAASYQNIFILFKIIQAYRAASIALLLLLFFILNFHFLWVLYIFTVFIFNWILMLAKLIHFYLNKRNFVDRVDNLFEFWILFEIHFNIMLHILNMNVTSSYQKYADGQEDNPCDCSNNNIILIERIIVWLKYWVFARLLRTNWSTINLLVLR